MPPWRQSSTGCIASLLLMTIACSTPLMGTRIFSATLPGSGWPRSSTKGRGFPGVAPVELHARQAEDARQGEQDGNR